MNVGITTQPITNMNLGTGFLVNVPGAWSDFTPVWTDLTVGNGTQVAKFTRIGNTVNFYLILSFGSTTSISGAPILTLPVSGMPALNDVPIGTCRYYDNGTAVYYGRLNYNGILVFDSVSGSLIGQNTVSSSSPFTWTTSDYIWLSGTYECA